MISKDFKKGYEEFLIMDKENWKEFLTDYTTKSKSWIFLETLYNMGDVYDFKTLKAAKAYHKDNFSSLSIYVKIKIKPKKNKVTITIKEVK